MMNMLFNGHKKDGPDEPKPDFPPVDIKTPLPKYADPEDPLETEVEDIILLDESPVIVPDDEPPAPGEGP